MFVLNKIKNSVLLFALMLLIASSFIFTIEKIEAHKPFFPPQSMHMEDSLFIGQPNISQVFYFELTPDKNEFWFKLNLNIGHDLVLDLGAPKFDTNKIKTSNLYLYYKNKNNELNQILSFEKKSDDFVNEFYEPYSKTYSWIYIKHRYEIMQNGEYYIKIKLSDLKSAKLWFATGLIEDFGMSDLANIAGNINMVQKFHTQGMNYTNSLEIEEKNKLSSNNFELSSKLLYVLILFIFVIILYLYINIILKHKAR